MPSTSLILWSITKRRNRLSLPKFRPNCNFLKLLEPPFRRSLALSLSLSLSKFIWPTGALTSLAPIQNRRPAAGRPQLSRAVSFQAFHDYLKIIFESYAFRAHAGFRRGRRRHSKLHPASALATSAPVRAPLSRPPGRPPLLMFL